jgi:hypothetical protein
MDIATPTHPPVTQLPADFAQQLMQALAATVPGADNAATAARPAAQQLFESLNPRDPADAQLAAIAVAAAQAAMDGFARAARPGLSDDTAVRLRSSALAAGRAYATVLRYLRKRQADAAPAKATPPPRQRRTQAARPEAERQPDDQPAPAPVFVEEPEFQARDRHGKPIPGHRTDLMTRAQVLAVLAYPRDPALEATAIAEEEAMIAAQAAQDAHSTAGSTEDNRGGRSLPDHADTPVAAASAASAPAWPATLPPPSYPAEC